MKVDPAGFQDIMPIGYRDRFFPKLRLSKFLPIFQKCP